MNIAHFTLGSVNPDSSNGINRVIESLCSYCNIHTPHRMRVMAVRSKNKTSAPITFHRNNFSVFTGRTVRDIVKAWDNEFSGTELVHFHNVWSYEHVSLSAFLRKKGVPYVITPYAAFEADRISQKNTRKKIFNLIGHQAFLKNAGAIVAGAREEIFGISKFVDGSKICFVPNSAQCVSIDSAQKTIEKSKERFTFAYLGRISREKNILSLILAVQLLKEISNRPFIVKLYGDYNNNYGRQCQKLIEELSLTDSCTLLGKVTSDQKPNVFEDCTVYIQPSLSDATPLSVVEAMSCGKSILATRTSGLTYLHGQRFFHMVEPTFKELAYGMKYYLEKHTPTPENIDLATKYYSDNFSSHAATEKMLKLYSDIINRREILPSY